MGICLSRLQAPAQPTVALQAFSTAGSTIPINSDLLIGTNVLSGEIRPTVSTEKSKPRQLNNQHGIEHEQKIANQLIEQIKGDEIGLPKKWKNLRQDISNLIHDEPKAQVLGALAKTAKTNADVYNFILTTARQIKLSSALVTVVMSLDRQIDFLDKNDSLIHSILTLSHEESEPLFEHLANIGAFRLIHHILARSNNSSERPTFPHRLSRSNRRSSI